MLKLKIYLIFEFIIFWPLNFFEILLILRNQNFDWF